MCLITSAFELHEAKIFGQGRRCPEITSFATRVPHRLRRKSDRLLRKSTESKRISHCHETVLRLESSEATAVVKQYFARQFDARRSWSLKCWSLTLTNLAGLRSSQRKGSEVRNTHHPECIARIVQVASFPGVKCSSLPNTRVFATNLTKQLRDLLNGLIAVAYDAIPTSQIKLL
jgi:hypothetical protein